MRRRYVLILGMAVAVVAMLSVVLARPGAPRVALGGGPATATPTPLPTATPTPTPPEPYFIVVLGYGQSPAPAVSGVKKTWTFGVENSPIPPCCSGVSPPVTLNVTLTGQADTSLTYNLGPLPEGYPRYVNVSSIVTAPPGGTVSAEAIAKVNGAPVAGATMQDTVGGSDSDGDGCTDDKELQPKSAAAYGGGRNPANFWDFMDMPVGMPPSRDKVVSVSDITAVVQHFGSMGDPAGDPLSSPPPAPSYHTAFDRRPPAMGTHYLALRPPDGAVSVSDIVAAVLQFGHSCL